MIDAISASELKNITARVWRDGEGVAQGRYPPLPRYVPLPPPAPRICLDRLCHGRYASRRRTFLYNLNFLHMYVFFADVNECNMTYHGCSHMCVNNQGSFRCECESGYELSADGRTCQGDAQCHFNYVPPPPPFNFFSENKYTTIGVFTIRKSNAFLSDYLTDLNSKQNKFRQK